MWEKPNKPENKEQERCLSLSVSVTLVVVIVISPVQSQDMPVDNNYLIRFFTNVNYRLSYEMAQ